MIHNPSMRFYLSTAAFFLFLFLIACSNQPGSDEQQSTELQVEPVAIDLDKIKERGKLVAISTYSPTSYFIYRGRPMGYEYELLQRLAEYLDVSLEIKVAHNLDEVFEMLNRGHGDIIAHNLAITKTRRQIVDFTEHHTMTQQVLVQRKPDEWRRMNPVKLDKMLIRSPYQLVGKEVYVRKNSSYHERLNNLEEEIGEDLQILPVPGETGTDAIIKQVAEGEYDYTVADQNIALINATYYDNLDIEMTISLPQKVAWAVRKTSPLLLEAVNSWINEMKQGATYYVIYNKYFKNRKAFIRNVSSDYSSLQGKRISQYDQLVYQNASKYGWDWRLVSSLIYQESQFRPGITSWAGAVGLMQLLPATAKRFGVSSLRDPGQNIKAGTSYLKYLDNFWKEIPDSLERKKFVLASYNAGPGHVSDARRLAEKYGKDPDIWDENVAEYIKLKSHPKYYRDPVVRHGYCRGMQPYLYVKKIIGRYRHYEKFIPEEPETFTAAL